MTAKPPLPSNESDGTGLQGYLAYHLIINGTPPAPSFSVSPCVVWGKCLLSVPFFLSDPSTHCFCVFMLFQPITD